MCMGYRDKCLEGKFNRGAFCDLRNLNDRDHPRNDTGKRDSKQRVQSPPENVSAREAMLT